LFILSICMYNRMQKTARKAMAFKNTHWQWRAHCDIFIVNLAGFNRILTGRQPYQTCVYSVDALTSRKAWASYIGPCVCRKCLISSLDVQVLLLVGCRWDIFIDATSVKRLTRKLLQKIASLYLQLIVLPLSSVGNESHQEKRQLSNRLASSE